MKRIDEKTEKKIAEKKKHENLTEKPVQKLAPINNRYQEIMLNTLACSGVLPTQHKMEVLAWHARDGAGCGPRAD
jgi:hypothetical protein